jgi:hypothetical protein
MKTQLILLTLAALPCLALGADVAGTWKTEFDSQRGPQKYTFASKQDGAKLTGKANAEVGDQKREAELKEGKVEGDTISFFEILSVQDNEIRITSTGKVVPRTERVDGLGADYTREFPPYSITILKLKTK